MPDKKDIGGLLPPKYAKKIRIFPIALAFAASFILNEVNKSMGYSAVFQSLGDLMLTGALLLALIAAFSVGLAETQTAPGGDINNEPEKPGGDTAPVKSGDKPGSLTQIQKDSYILPDEKNDALNASSIALIVLFSAVFACIAYWRITKAFATLPADYKDVYRYSITNTVAALVFPLAAAIYLKLRENSSPIQGDKTSRGILTLLSYASFVYAAVIAVAAAININLSAILQWLYYIVTSYLFIAFTVNVAMAFIKGDIHKNFNYTIIPVKSSKEDFEEDAARLKISLKSLYTIKYTLAIAPGIVLGLGFTLLLSTTLYVVEPWQQAVVYRFGKLNGIVSEGIHFKLPWPIDKTDIYDVHRVNSMEIGYECSDEDDNFLWSLAHDGGEYTLLLGNGNETVAVNLKVVYQISDLYSYVKSYSKPEEVLSAAAYEALLARTVNTTIDVFLSTDRSLLSASMADELSAVCASEGLGLSIVSVIVESIHPPIDIAGVYQGVVTASIDKNTKIISAQTSAEKALTDAYRQSKTAVDNAKTAQYNKVAAAQKEMAVYHAAMEAYAVNPESFEITKYLNTYEIIIGGSKVYVFSPGTEDSISKSVIGKGQLLNLQSVGGAYE